MVKRNKMEWSIKKDKNVKVIGNENLRGGDENKLFL